MATTKKHAAWQRTAHTLAIVAVSMAWSLAIASAKTAPPGRQAGETPQVATAGTTATSAKSADGIAWFDGDVDAAFAHAKAERKPVFLYWTAEWCPPCHELQATLFTRPEFQEKLKLFVPVYLDADAPGAQKWSDTFHIVGYPTLVMLKGDRTELARVLGGMDLTRYNDVLDLVLADVRPVREVLASLDRNSDPLSRDDCRRLAYNAWIIDESMDSAPAKMADDLQRAVDRCPAAARTERARLTVAAALASSNADAEALRAGKPPNALTKKLIERVYDVLGDRQLTRGAADTLTWLAEGFFTAAKSEANNTRKFLERWNRAMNAVADDPHARDADRIAALAFELRAMTVFNAAGKIPPKFAATARQRIEEALSKEHSQDARIAVVSYASNVLYLLGDTDRLFAVLDRELKTAKQPYYYMSMLADLEEQRGNKDKAIAWLERAYHEPHGAASRFQWGADYVIGLTRLRPDDAAGIRNAALTVLGELDGPDRIYMRSAGRLKRLDSALREWNKDGAHATDIAELRKRMDGICGKIPEVDAARQKCDAFLAKT